MNPSSLIIFVYAALVIAGGVLGFIKAGSRPSLIAGLVSGLLLLAAGVGLGRGLSWGLPLAATLTAALLIFFGVRGVRTRAFMPGGLLAVLSLLTLAGLWLTRGR